MSCTRSPTTRRWRTVTPCSAKRGAPFTPRCPAWTAGDARCPGRFSFPAEPHRTMVGPSSRWPMAPPASAHDCGPSRQPDLMGYAPLIQSFLADKYAVALTDYEGLGESGSHPYLEPRTEAFNTVDAVRAMRAISATVSARWMAVGYSQGGQAAWAANELNSYYGNDLQLQGSVALAPAANLTGHGRHGLVGIVDRRPTGACSAGHCRLGSLQPGSGRRLVSARVSRVLPRAAEPLRATRQSTVNRPSTRKGTSPVASSR